MNQLQLNRWKQFSLGLAKNAYPKITTARRSKLIAKVEECVEWVVCNDLGAINDWDRTEYRNGKFYEDSASARVGTWLWDNGYDSEKEDRHGETLGRFGIMVMCCVRAGFDVAVAPSVGVIGYTVGDVRNIFDGGVPAWVNEYFEAPLAGVGDSEGVWL